MKVSNEIMEKVSEVLKNQEAVDKMNQASSNEEIYTTACEYMQGVSQEDFTQAMRDLKEAGGSIELTEEELDSVAGGIKAKEGKFTTHAEIVCLV